MEFKYQLKVSLTFFLFETSSLKIPAFERFHYNFHIGNLVKEILSQERQK